MIHFLGGILRCHLVETVKSKSVVPSLGQFKSSCCSEQVVKLPVTKIHTPDVSFCSHTAHFSSNVMFPGTK